MSNFENLKESLTLLSRQNPLLVQNILKLQENKKFEEFVFENTHKQELNLLYKKKYGSFHLHSQEGAAKESSHWCKSLDPNRQVLFIFGTGLGYSFLFLKKWLESSKEHHLVYLEPHLGVLFHLFQTEIGKKIVGHSQVHLFHFTRKNNLDYLIEYLAAYFSLLKPLQATLPAYTRAYPNLAKYIQSTLTTKQDMLTTRLIETKTSSNQSFINYLNKFPQLSGNFNASKFGGLFKNIPCIICGAGPSLKKNLSTLKELGQRALILAGSSAIPALTASNLTPHFGNFFDPYARVHERFLKTTAFEMPTFHCARTYYETSRWIHGPKLYTKGSDDMPFVDWMENELGFEGTLIKEYISVTAYNTSLAMHMGCNPIIYVGVDLAYTDNEAYMSGVQKDVDYNEKKDSSKEGFEFNEDLWATDIYGKPVLTRFGWQVESNFLRDITAPYREVLQVINATEGGLGIDTVPNMSLKEVADKFLHKSYPFEEWIHTEIAPFQVRDPQIEKKCLGLLKEFQKSLARVQKQYRSVLKEAKALKKKNKCGELEELDETYLKNAEHSISQEIAYQYYMMHHHQVVDIEHLKTHNLFRLVSIDAPQTLTNEINLSRVINKYSRYLGLSEVCKIHLNNKIKETEKDPWE